MRTKKKVSRKRPYIHKKMEKKKKKKSEALDDRRELGMGGEGGGAGAFQAEVMAEARTSG